jgi:hypothetical protein
MKQGSQWSATDEVVGGSAKQAKNGNRSVAEILKAASVEPEAARLFIEYAETTRGRNLVVWTPGLRELCGLVEEEKSDGELAEEVEAGGEIVCALEPDTWAVICAHKLRGKLLGALQRGGREELQAWFDLYSLVPLWSVPAPPG